jgi:hypothetical protein
MELLFLMMTHEWFQNISEEYCSCTYFESITLGSWLEPEFAEMLVEENWCCWTNL